MAKGVLRLNGATADGNRIVAELKAEQKAVEATDRAETIKGEVEALQGEKERLTGQYRRLREPLLSAKDIATLRGKKNHNQITNNWQFWRHRGHSSP